MDIVKVCAVPDCNVRHYAKGWCRVHYLRWTKSGDPQNPGGRDYERVDPLTRLLERVEIGTTGCWLFQGVSRRDGYGTVGLAGKGGRKVLAHRLTYERMVGPVPDGWHLHHRCHVPACCNPDHLVALSPSEHRDAHRPDVCHRGHDEWRVKPNGQRDCRVCHREREAARQRRLRAA